MPRYNTSNKPSNQSIERPKPKQATEWIARKRPLPTSGSSPDRKTRRMTIAPQTLISRTPPKSSARDRRLSYLPPASVQRDITHRSPTKAQSPVKSRPIPRPKIMAEEHIITEPLKQPIVEKASTRLLDAYGIPVNQRARPAPSSGSPTHQQGSLEAFLHSKSTKTINQTTTKTSTAISLNTANDLNQRIRVCVRKRPLNKKEISNQEIDIAPLRGSRTIELNAPKTRIDLTRYTETHTFTFDDTFDGSSSNTQIYARTAQPLVDYIFKGGKATCFAHGQTGSGKTYTMLDPNHGLYVLAAQDIFRLLSSEYYAHLSASVGFYEIYQGQLFDLLNQKNKLVAREDGNGNVVIAGLREYPINNVEDLMSVFEYGNQGRTTGKTGANNKSSRSHAVLQILLKTKTTPPKVYGKLSFIDLAGSERGADRGDANDKTRQEGAEINKSLLALKECIRALDQNKNHTPFRGSKLTQVLRDSFTGDSRTCMIATISPNNSNSEHTLNTLRYADRVKQLRGENDPRLMGDYGRNADSNEGGLVTVEGDVEIKDTDSQSVSNSDAIYENDASENLLEVDFPSNEVAANALTTPTNERYYHAISAPELTTDRQEKYLQRLESPPAEVFDQSMDDPFFSAPLVKDGTANQPVNIEASEFDLSLSTATATTIAATTFNEARLRNFVRMHRTQIHRLEECIKKEKMMLGKISMAILTESSGAGDMDDDLMDHQQLKEDYEEYLNDLDDILDQEFELVNGLRSKIKDELEE
ncbi:hypothetical protein HMPREF1544_05714 [Mucor circinelloides 1006PhL]|uniref:Kinesin-like protein n=1 Tax=Mucor circinelloides f. circinelloides (strain 1006PhL) TaxID=1220926 RepID=S2K5P3_MUCC1|nr:hypothetical protein HMPREF1544_05714 [Mucor circinelloides 1006PhL]